MQRLAGLGVMFIVTVAMFVLAQLFGIASGDGDPQSTLAFFGSSVIFYFMAGVAIGMFPKLIEFNFSICVSAATLSLIIGVASLRPEMLTVGCVIAVFLASIERPLENPSISAKFVRRLGDSSYSVYLTHSFVLGPMVALGMKINVFSSWTGYIFCLLAIIVCAIVGIYSFLLIERPLMNYFRLKMIGAHPSRSVQA